MSKIKFGKKSKIAVISLAVVAIVSSFLGVGAFKTNSSNDGTLGGNSEIEKTMSILTADNALVERTISGCTFTGESSHLVVATGTEYTLNNCTFVGAGVPETIDETKDYDYKAIKVVGGTLNLNNCSITNGYGENSGVGVYSNAGTLNITDTEISGNTLTSGYGAALYIDGAVTVNLLGKTIIANNQITDTINNTNGGSAIYIKGVDADNQATLNIGTVKVVENEEVVDVAFTGTISENNVANGNGTINAASYTRVNLNSGTLGQNTLTDASGSEVIYNANTVNGDGEVFYIGATSTLYIKNEATLKGMIATESPMIIGGNIFYEGNSVDIQNYIYTVKAN